MKVLVIGASGKVGRQVIENLNAAGHQAIAMVRSAQQMTFFQNKSVSTVLGDLEGPFEHAFQEAEAVIFVAGSPKGSEAVKNLSIDQEGAIRAIDLAEEFGVSRFIMVSVKNADQPYQSVFDKSFIMAKHRADEHLRKSSLNYTIVRPCQLTDQEPTGCVHLQAHIPEDCEITRGDVARVLVQLIDIKASIRQEFDLQNGTVPVEDILQ